MIKVPSYTLVAEVCYFRLTCNLQVFIMGLYKIHGVIPVITSMLNDQIFFMLNSIFK